MLLLLTKEFKRRLAYRCSNQHENISFIKFTLDVLKDVLIFCEVSEMRGTLYVETLLLSLFYDRITLPRTLHQSLR